jgi:hypothetical protein
MNMQEQARKVEKIIAKAWMDEGFKQRLLSDPTATLKEQGVELAPGVEVRIVEDTVNVQHLVLPAKPIGELSEEVLSQVAGGAILASKGGCKKC